MCLAVPAHVTAIVDAEARTARVSVLGVSRVISLGVLDGVGPGDWVLVYMGCALEKIGEADAAEAVRLWEELCTSFPSR